MPNLFVTSYRDPDLDGYAGACAYAEFLRYNATSAEAVFFGSLHAETKFLLDRFFIKPAPLKEIAEPDDSYILVDASELAGLEPSIKPDQITEIIDHRMVNDAALFRNAQINIELVGAACTLVAERFMRANTPITQKSAVLLAGGIVSNTLNFKSTLTTDRDRQAYDWLMASSGTSNDLARDMFAAKTEHVIQNLHSAIEHDYALFTFSGLKVGFCQLEIIDASSVMERLLQEMLSILKNIQSEFNLDYIFLSLVDIEGNKNIYVTDDPTTQYILSNTLDITFHNTSAERAGLLMRKQTVPLLKAYFEKKSNITI